MFIKPAKIVWALMLVTTSGLVVMASTVLPTMFTTPQEHQAIGRPDFLTASDHYDAILAPDHRLHGGADDPFPQQAPGFWDSTEYMIGTVRVSVILLESDGTVDTQTENWATSERTNVQGEVQAALNWWAGRATANGVTLSFSVDWSNLNSPIATDYEPINRCGPCSTGQALWIQEAMTALGYNSFTNYFTNVRDYNNDLRNNAGMDWGFTIFVVDSSNDGNNRFTDNYFAYAYLGGPFTVMTYGNNGWGIGRMNMVTAHEMGHIFYALDEYAASGCTNTERSGYYNTVNANCENSGTGNANIMIANTLTGASPRVETREMIGWRDSDSDGIEDVLDTFPTTTLNAYSPDPSFDTTPTYTGSSTVVARTNNNPRGPGNDVTINTIANIQYRVDSGSWIGASASDGAFDEPAESFTFTTSTLSTGVHTICARATNSEGNIGTSSCDTLTIGDNVPPVANAGPNQIVNEGATVSFSGAGSTDNVGIVTYEWDFDASDGVTFTDATGVSASHEYGDNGAYTVTLRCIDAAGNFDTDTLTVTVSNVAPSVNAGANQAINEGASASMTGTFTDPGWLDTHTATINWGEGTVEAGLVSEENVKPDSTGTVSKTHTYGDNGVFTVTLTVCDDDGGCSSDTLTVTVSNLAPTVDPLSSVTISEGQSASFIGHATDPGSDDLTFQWTWGYRSACDTSTTYLNSPPNADPLPSPSVNPRDITETKSCQYGDNGAFTVTLQVTDDDGSSTTVSATLTVTNLNPTIIAYTTTVGPEGGTATLSAVASDQGSDDLTFQWAWGSRSVCDGSTTYLNNPPTADLLPSPSVNPITVTDSPSCQYGDNGVFPVTLTVTDDDAGSATITTSVQVVNVNPSVTPLSNLTVPEGTTVALTGQGTDPGSDDLTFNWSWGGRSACDSSTTYLNNPPNADPLPSPTINPRSVSETKSCQYGDNGVFMVSLTVSDDDGGFKTQSMTLTVTNVNPNMVTNISAYIKANVTLRAAGEKWHDLNLTLYNGNTPTHWASVYRVPGDPDAQSSTINNVHIDVLNCQVSAVVTYTPLNDPINGQVNGATPGWIILTLEDGTEVWLNHTFNVKHPSTWVWTIPNLCPHVSAAGLPIYFEATASDVGSDDLTFTWKWGDSQPDTVTTHYNNGVSADPYPSPSVNPITAKDQVTHTFSSSGTFTIQLTVTDDDTGSVSQTVVLTI
jgi:PKD repeat protein